MESAPSGPKINTLNSELKGILSQDFLLGHRGANDLNNPREMQNDSRIKADLQNAIDRASNIEFLITAETEGIQSEDFEKVEGVVGKPEDLETVGYHPDDRAVPVYALNMGARLVKTYDKVIYRKKGVHPMEHPIRLWAEELQWKRISDDFGVWYKDILNPARRMVNLRDSQKSLGRNTQTFDAALNEILALVNS